MFIYAGNKEYLANTKFVKKSPLMPSTTLIATQEAEESIKGKTVLN
jgi:hypothetical protein